MDSSTARARLKLPPLNAVRAFEAAGRHLSFARAADELCVTQAAVSQQVKQLEGALGVQLFIRGPGGLELSSRGKRYFVAINNAFEIMVEATEELHGQEQQQTLRISAQPNFVARWLVQRLWKFKLAHPDIVLSVGAGTGGPDFNFADSEVDVAIRYARDFPGLETHSLFRPEVIPVCSPALASQLKTPADLKPHLLLRSKYLPDQWRLMLEQIGALGMDHQQGPLFDSTLLAVEAAKSGLGVALAHLPFVVDELAAHELVVAFDGVVNPEEAWQLIYPTSARAVPKVIAFRRWILQEVEEAKARERHVWLACTESRAALGR